MHHTAPQCPTACALENDVQSGVNCQLAAGKVQSAEDVNQMASHSVNHQTSRGLQKRENPNQKLMKRKQIEKGGEVGEKEEKREEVGRGLGLLL
ncbi:hypothetical protein ACLKA6_009969 [Drosophila palustris]